MSKRTLDPDQLDAAEKAKSILELYASPDAVISLAGSGPRPMSFLYAWGNLLIEETAQKDSYELTETGKLAWQRVVKDAPEERLAHLTTIAMRAFEPHSSVLRYREADKWHACDVMGMREAVKAILTELRPADIPRKNGRVAEQVSACVGGRP